MDPHDAFLWYSYNFALAVHIPKIEISSVHLMVYSIFHSILTRIFFKKSTSFVKEILTKNQCLTSCKMFCLLKISSLCQQTQEMKEIGAHWIQCPYLNELNPTFEKNWQDQKIWKIIIYNKQIPYCEFTITN